LVLAELLRRAHIDSSEINESLANPLHADRVVACQGVLCSLARLLVTLSTEADLMKKSLATTFFMLGSILLMVLVYARGTDAQGSSESSQIQIGMDIAPVRLDLKGKNRSLVGLGSYIVNAQGGCNDCHTNPSYAPGHDPFMGEPEQVNAAHYLAGGQTFGPFTSRNLTPEPETDNLPAGLTREQFRLVLRTGVDLDHAHPQFGPLLQVMPWPTYSHMTNRDIDAIYEYLRSIPHAEPGTVAAGS
jgi:hypothetical protein